MEIDFRLAKVAPFWFAKITKAKTFKALLSKTKVVDEDNESVYTLDLSQPAFCMCGESHGFTGQYYNSNQKTDDMVVQSGCSICTDYSGWIYQCIKNNQDAVAFRNYITQYLDHIQNSHSIRLPR